MNIRQRFSAEETVLRILDVAEEHFRRVGYAKTAIADLADELGMSSANIYRYFPSKSAINEAICKRLFAEMETIIAEIVARDASAASRLSDMLMAMHDFNRSRYTSERRMHEMVAVAMEENWGAVQEHIASFVGSIARLLAEGVETGEFKPVSDVAATALTVDQACCCILHPMMIAECSRLEMDRDGHAARLIEFVVNALKR